MKRRLLKLYPLLVVAAVAALLLGVQWHDAHAPESPSIFRRLEWMTHDWRVRVAFPLSAPSAATNLAAIEIENQTIRWMNRELPDKPRWPFSYYYYGIFIDELKAQGATASAFDVFFPMQDGSRFTWSKLTGTTNPVSSQGFFAERLRAHGNVILAVASDHSNPGKLDFPQAQLRDSAKLGHVKGGFDQDGVLRTVPVFLDDPQHGRYWALGVELAARQLGLDLNNAQILPDRVVLRGSGGVVREIPTDSERAMMLDWTVNHNHPRPEQRVKGLIFRAVLENGLARIRGGMTRDLGLDGRLVVLGAGSTGGNIYDRSPTALGARENSYLAHLNIANSLLTGRFVSQLSWAGEASVIVGLALLAAGIGWRLHTWQASAAIGVLAVAYVGLAVWIYVAHRILLPVALPVVGALLATHLAMTACRMLENAERQRLERLLKMVVAPKIIDSLLALNAPMPETHRAEITVMFADLRGFTRFAEESQTRAEREARAVGLAYEEARAFADDAARAAMDSVNRYLAAVVEEIKATDGTLDKYMGDCVMAFWGAPVADPRHAANALKCAAAVQQATEQINQEHVAENLRRGEVNAARELERQPPVPLLPVLRLGIGLNSGVATVGFMGSETHLSSYTAFGHVVNVANRVEGLAGGGEIILTEQTLLSAARDDAVIATRCAERLPVTLKGVTSPVKVFELRWNDAPDRVPRAATA